MRASCLAGCSDSMHDKPEIEQFLFDPPTLDHLARFAAQFPNPCCLCTPSLGQELEWRGVKVTTLDIDSRFAGLRGFRLYDLDEPEWLGEEYGIIICDPPFLSVPLKQVYQAISVLCGNNYKQPLLVNYLSSRAPLITSIFAPFGLRPTGYRPGYAHIQNSGQNRMEFYGNIGPEYSLNLEETAIKRF